MVTRLFVYGALLSAEGRLHKGIHVRAVKYAILHGYTLRYDRIVRNRALSKYWSQAHPRGAMLGMLNIYRSDDPTDVVFGKVIYLDKANLEQTLKKEPCYKLVPIGPGPVYTLHCTDDRYLRDGVEPNPVYKAIVEAEAAEVRRAAQERSVGKIRCNDYGCLHFF